MKPALIPSIWLLPILSGWLLSLSCPPQSLTPTVWIALVPLFVFLAHDPRPLRALWGGWLSGLTYALIIVHPLLSLVWWGWALTSEEYTASLRQQQRFLHVWYPLTALWCSMWWGLWGAALVWLARSARSRVWWAAALWLLICEHLRRVTFFDFTWGFLGYALHPYPVLRQLAAVTGILGLSALIVLVNAWIAHALRACWALLRPSSAHGGATPTHALRELGLAASVLGAALGSWGLGVQNASHREEAGSATISVATLQVSPHTYTKEEYAAGALDWTYTPLLEGALERGAKLLVLPEGVWLAKLRLDETPLPATLSRHVRPSEIAADLAQWLGDSGAVVLVGFDVATQGHLYNSIVSWDAQGLRSQYHKRRLTPFAEYPPGPFRHLAPRNRLTFTPGQGAQLFAVDSLRVGGFICQEAQFPDLIRQSVREGAQLLVSSGNDGIFRHPAVAEGHHIAAIFRAIETHRPLVRAMKTGISSIIDPHGQVLTAAGIKQEALLLRDVAASHRTTFYTRWGDWLVGLCAALTLTIGLLRLISLLAARRRDVPERV